MVNGEIVSQLNVISRANAPSRAQRVLSPDDVLYQTVRPYQKNNFFFKQMLDLPAVASTGYAQIRGLDCSIKFIYHLLHTDKFVLEAMKRSTGTSYPAISSNDLAEIDVCYPTRTEQQKIADFLSLVDERIEKQRQLVEVLKRYKRGLLAHIFNNIQSENILSLGSVCNITTGKLDANAMTPNGKYRFYTCAKEYYQIDKYAFDTEALLISGNGANVGYIHHYKGKFNAYQRTYVLDSFHEEIMYVYYYLQAYLHPHIESEKKAGNTPYIVLSTLAEMKIPFPSKDVQSRIAQALSIIDLRINCEQTVLNNLDKQKSGLLQQMFI